MSDDGYVGEEVAARYDEDRSPVSTPAVLQPTVDLLAELARGGRGLELGIGTGIPGMRGHVAQLQRGYGPRPYEGGCAMADRETNKQIVTAFYELAFNGKEPEQAVEKYMGSEYIQHNPQAPDGADAFI